MKKGYLVYWNHIKTQHQKFRAVKSLNKALRLKQLLSSQSKYINVWVTKFEDI